MCKPCTTQLGTTISRDIRMNEWSFQYRAPRKQQKTIRDHGEAQRESKSTHTFDYIQKQIEKMSVYDMTHVETKNPTNEEVRYIKIGYAYIIISYVDVWTQVKSEVLNTQQAICLHLSESLECVISTSYWVDEESKLWIGMHSPLGLLWSKLQYCTQEKLRINHMDTNSEQTWHISKIATFPLV